MAGFVQIVEFKTSRLEEVQALGDEMAPERASGTVRRLTVAADRDRPGSHFSIVEFDSYESAMENSNRPEPASSPRRWPNCATVPRRSATSTSGSPGSRKDRGP